MSAFLRNMRAIDEWAIASGEAHFAGREKPPLLLEPLDNASTALRQESAILSGPLVPQRDSEKAK
jgi:hypothetical protein